MFNPYALVKIKDQAGNDSGPMETTSGNAAGMVDGSLNYANNVHLGARQGHGFAAEKANHLYDKVTGKDAQLVGGDNAKNGADRIVNGIKIQTKYCKTAQESVNAAFDDTSGNFKYVDSQTNTRMQIEVPSDHYNAAVNAMEQKIRDGKMPGIDRNDVAAAKDLVRQGKFTYAQAKNLAKAGTIESLSYDAVNGITLAGTAMGITASVTFAVAILNGKDWQEALDNACFESLCVGGVAWVGSVLTAQVGRAGLDQALRGTTDWLVKKMGVKATNWLASALRSGETLSDAAAKNLMSKVLRGNIVAGVVTTVVLSTDDFINLFDGKASKMQTFKNVSKTASGVAGGTAGWISGVAAGATLGSFIPILGTAVGGVIGAVIGGGAASAAASIILDSYIEDDAKVMLRKLETVFAQMAEDHLLTIDEADIIIKEFQKFDVPGLLRDMYARENRNVFVKQIFSPLVDERMQARPVIRLPTDEQVLEATIKLIGKISDVEPSGHMKTSEAQAAGTALEFPKIEALWKHGDPEQGEHTDASSNAFNGTALSTQERTEIFDFLRMSADAMAALDPEIVKAVLYEMQMEKVQALASQLTEDSPSQPADQHFPEPPPVAQKKVRELGGIFDDYEVHLNDGGSFFTGMELLRAKGRKKVKNAIESYANNGGKTAPNHGGNS
jgi:hypothetical protein